MSEKYYGNYLGYVISNASPLKDGTVQVFVPAVNARIFKDWVNAAEDKFFKFGGTNIASLLTPEMEEFLMETLPWARISQPVVGSGSSGYKNQQNATVSDGNFEEQRRADNPQQTYSNANTSEAIRDGKKLGGSSGNGGFSTNSSNDGDKFVPKYSQTAYNESGIYRTSSDPAAVGAISSGIGDYGGKSYGTYQFPSKNSTDLQNFVNWRNNPFGGELKGLVIGSPAFDAKWKEIAERDNKRFGQAQEFFQETLAWDKDMREFQKLSGVNLENRSPELKDLIAGTVNQYRGLSQNQARHIARNGGDSLTDKQIGILLQNYKLANVEPNFKSSSPSVRNAVRNRIKSERSIFENMSGSGVSSTSPNEGGNTQAKAQSEEAIINPEVAATTSLNSNDHIGAKAGVAFENSKDQFDETGEERNNKNANPTAAMYNHTNYSNMAKGSVSIPQPGAYVWTFFEGGDPNYPVVFGYHYGQQDVKDLWDANSESPDYPPATPDEFHTGNVQGEESNKYRNKFVINERGGSIDIVSTTGRERVKLTHFKGSHLEFNPLGGNHYVNGQNQILINGNQFETIRGHDNYHVDSDRDEIILGNSYLKVGDIKKWTPKVKEIKDLLKDIHKKKRLFEIQRAESIDELDQSPEQKKSGTPAPCGVCQKPHGRVVNNSFTQTTPDECPSCGGTGESPSSQDGEWDVEPEKELLSAEIESSIPKLAELEKELANDNFNDGGGRIELIAGDKVINVGLVFNDLEAHRKDEKGKFVPYGVNVDKNGLFPDYVATPLVESVHVDPIPGGDLIITSGNKVSLIAGANGMQLKTAGRFDAFGSITNIAAEQLNLSSRSETTIDGGKRLALTGDVMSVQPRILDRDGLQTKNFVVDANLHVSTNLAIAGSAHIDGELTVSHITAPVEEQYADILPGVVIGVTESGEEVISVAAMNAVKIYNIPLYLPESHGDVRELAKDKINQLYPSPANKVSNIRRVAEIPAQEHQGIDEPFINTHGEGAEETLDAGKKFEEAMV
jgi:hypothetical protein